MRHVITGGAAALGLAVALSLGTAARGEPLSAGAAVLDIALPAGVPLAGYGGFPRRAWLPDVLDLSPHAFWFRASTGVHDSPRVRALVLAAGGTRLVWLAADLVAPDPTLLVELRQRLAAGPLGGATVLLSASHTHSGPGAYARSALFAIVAVDRLSDDVRGAVVDAFERAVRAAHATLAPALVGSARTEVTGVAVSRLGAPLDPELGVLRFVRPDGRPVAMLWNYAIHGTALGRRNLLLSGDVMGEASTRLERALGAPALFVNGAVADVSPAARGVPGVRGLGQALADAALRAWGAAAVMPDVPVAIAAGQVALGEPGVAARNCLGRWVPGWIRVGLARALPRESEMLAVAIGRTAWVAVPGELETRLGLEVKRVIPPGLEATFVAGLTNGYLGYFLSREVAARPGYLACASLYGERAGETIRDAGKTLLSRLAFTPDPALRSRPRRTSGVARPSEGS